MAPNVTVPMNFGRHLLSSPTHNTLKLNTSEGGVVYASSVILSFNSPVIDHMTTTLHMTSVDMLEFSETAVKVFVDAAYSGTIEGLNRDMFRDVNKMANVFEVSWLAGECAQYFSEIADSVETASYQELLYLFDEAAFVLEHLGTKEFLEVAIRKIELLEWKQQFLNEYLVNAEGLSTKKLDMAIKLAGGQVYCVVKTLCTQLTEQLGGQNTIILSDHSRYLLNNIDLHSCRQSDPALFEELFNILEKLPESVDNLKWTYQLYRNSHTNNLSSTVSRSNDIANMYMDGIDFEMSFNDLLDWISTSGKVRNMLSAIEAVWAWDVIRHYHLKITHSTHLPNLVSDISKLQTKKVWKLLPHNFLDLNVYFSGIFLKKEKRLRCDRFCQYPEDTPSSVLIDCAETYRNPLTLLFRESELTFHYKPLSVSHCDLPGECGFILKTIPPHAGLLNKLTLCVEKKDYLNKSVHFHEEMRAENMHVFVERIYNQRSFLYCISWLGSLKSSGDLSEQEFLAFFNHHGFQNGSRFKVLYNFD